MIGVFDDDALATRPHCNLSSEPISEFGRDHSPSQEDHQGVSLRERKVHGVYDNTLAS